MKRLKITNRTIRIKGDIYFHEDLQRTSLFEVFGKKILHVQGDGIDKKYNVGKFVD